MSQVVTAIGMTRTEVRGGTRTAMDDRATRLRRKRQGTIFDDNGIGQVEVEFLGKRRVIGCIEGEEDRAIRLAHQFEIDTGEVLKAVRDLDEPRAMLMAGILAREQIEELEDDVRAATPVSTQIELDHNSSVYRSAVAAVDQLIIVVEASNLYRQSEPEDQERRLAELKAGRTLLTSKWLSLDTVKVVLVSTLTYLLSKFADAPIGEAASLAWKAVKTLLGIQ